MSCNGRSDTWTVGQLEAAMKLIGILIDLQIISADWTITKIMVNMQLRWVSRIKYE